MHAYTKAGQYGQQRADSRPNLPADTRSFSSGQTCGVAQDEVEQAGALLQDVHANVAADLGKVGAANDAMTEIQRKQWGNRGVAVDSQSF